MLITFSRTRFRVPANREPASRPVTRRVVALLGPAVVTAGLVAGVCGTPARAAESTQVAFTGVERVVAFASPDAILAGAAGVATRSFQWRGSHESHRPSHGA